MYQILQVVVLYASSSVDKISLITTVLLKTDGKAGWFAAQQQGCKNTKQNWFERQSKISGKTPVRSKW